MLLKECLDGKTKRSKPKMASHLKRAFRHFDKNGDGFIDKEELRAILTSEISGGKRLTDEQVDAVMR